MNAEVHPSAWQVMGNSAVLKGFAFGSHYPMLIVTVGGHALIAEERAAIERVLGEVLPMLGIAAEPQTPADGVTDGFAKTVEWLLATMHRLQLAVELPVYEGGRLLAAAADQARFCLPTTENALLPLHQVLQLVLELMRAPSQASGVRHDLGRLSAALAELRNAGAMGLNVPKFMRAALQMGIPFQALTGVVQYGHGRRGRWLDSTFTDETPYIAASLARNKQLAARALRLAGIPVPDHFMVHTVEAALEAAGRLGYPIVVKPADQDGNMGVTADLISPEELPAAFQRARQYSGNVLVEKHIAGKDYRVIVFHGEVIWAHQRMPAGIVGDGQHSVEELVNRLNADPRRGTGLHAQFKPLPLDQEAADMLRRQGLTTGSVPAEGQFARLRRASNQRNGGQIAPMLDQVHPDNKALAVRAAQALRLDIAGVDLIIEDIARSWRETGAAINDVNGQPGTRQMDPEIPSRMLRKLVPGDGRIPTVVVLGAAPTNPLVRGLEAVLLRGQVVTGCHDAAGVRVNGQIIMEGTVAPYDAGLAMSVDRSVGTVVVSVHDESVLRTGLPFPRFDVLVLAGAHILPHCAAPETPNLVPVLHEMLASILPACDGVVMTIDNSGLELNGFEHLTSARWQHLPAEAETFYRAVIDHLREAEARHAMPREQRSAVLTPTDTVPA